MVDTKSVIASAIEEIQRDSAGGKVVIALSGGVDSSVCAALGARAIGDRLIPIYVDTGLMRKGETGRIRAAFGHLNLTVVQAEDEFLDALRGITDPEQKRKVIGERFIRVFEREAEKTGATSLLQGTIYPDRIESEGGIKSHHNVGGMPEKLLFSRVIEPLRDLYKDEVREVARALGLPHEIKRTDAVPRPRPGSPRRRGGDPREYRGGPRGERDSRGRAGPPVPPVAVLCGTHRAWDRGEGRQPHPWLDSRGPCGELP